MDREQELTLSDRPGGAEGFRHEALLYRGPDDGVRQVAAFVREGLRRDETPCVVIDRDRIDGVATALGADAGRVRFEDMRVLGRNPGRLISVWADLVRTVTGEGGRIRGVGEPVWASRTPEELAECARHEALLNLAFEEGPAWRLACPYDVSALRPGLVDEARRNHPEVTTDGSSHVSTGYRAPDGPVQLGGPLAPAPITAETWELGVEGLPALRRAVLRFTEASGAAPARADDLALAVDEVASNSLRHAGEGVARLWRTDTDVLCEVEDPGTIDDPLAGRRRPAPGSTSGYGLWLAHQLCDLVQVRSTPTGTLVRLRVAR